MSTKQSKSVKKTPATKATKSAAPAKKAAAPAKKAAAPATKKVVAPKKAAAPAKKATTTKKAAAPKKGGATKATTPAPKAANPAPVVADGAEGEENSKTRYFKVIIGDAELPHGRFSGSKPKQAANKALTSIFKSKEQSGGSVTGKVKFSIVECTRGSKHKKYHYVGERVKLKEPMKVTIGKGDNAKVIEYKFNNKVMKDKTVTA